MQQQKNRLTLALLITSFVVLAVSGIYAAYDPNSPAQTHNALTDIDAIRENTNQLRKHEAGATEPSNLVAGMLWYDITNDLLKLRNEANTAWLSLYDFANGKIAADTVQSTSIKAGTTAVVVSANDTTKGYLNGKLVGSSTITLTENNDGGAETLTLSSPVMDAILFSNPAEAIAWVWPTIKYFGFSSASYGTTEGEFSFVAPKSGTLKSLYVQTLVGTLTNGSGGWKVTVYKNGAATSLATLCATTTNGVASDTSNTVTVAAGDRISLQLYPGSSYSGNVRIAVSVVFAP